MTFTRIPWTGVEARRNVLSNPSGLVADTGYVRQTSHGTLTTTPGVDTRVTTTTSGRAIGTTGIIIDTLTVGTDLLPATDYVLSVEVLGQVDGTTARSILVNAEGAGAAVIGNVTFSQSSLTRREVTFTTGASGDVQIRVLNGQATITGSNAIIFRNAIVETEATFAGYFDGASADTALERYDWTGTANQSASTLNIPNPATDQMTPDVRIRFPYEAERETRTSVMDLLESEDSRTVYFPPTLRRGTLTAVFSDPADAIAGMDWLVGNYDYLLEHPTAPHADMTFAVAGDSIRIRQGAAATELLIPFRELPT